MVLRVVSRPEVAMHGGAREISRLTDASKGLQCRVDDNRLLTRRIIGGKEDSGVCLSLEADDRPRCSTVER
jgi:hypothetical protein